jgi:peptide-methionine (S)-S-oxide reductase
LTADFYLVMLNNMENRIKTAVFGGGCFWCTEAIFQKLRGVKSVISGYAGGAVPNPTYEQVSSGSTGHAEVIKIDYDPQQVTYRDLLEVFFATHDPTTLNQQGNDRGTQYRSVIFYADDEQHQEAEAITKQLTEEKVYSQPIVTQVAPLVDFYPAEDYHQNYYNNNSNQPYCQLVINPKLQKFKQKFAQLMV